MVQTKNKGVLITVLVFCFTFMLVAASRALAHSPSAEKPGWRLTFEDNFAGNQLDLTKWSYLPERPWMDGNRSSRAVFLDGQGHLVIQISEHNGSYYFGAITTRGKFEQAYGYYEIRAQLPQEEGLWAAFWLMTDGAHRIGDGGRDGTEIDILESPFAKQDRISHALHWDGYEEHHQSAGKTPYIPGIYDGFHIFALEWNEEEYIFYVDGQETWRTSAGGISQVPSWVQLTATVGKWAGDIRNAKLPAQYIIDYVRVYERIHEIEISSPANQAVVSAHEPVRFEILPEIDVEEICVMQNESEIYRGAKVPQDLRLCLPVFDEQEEHRVKVVVTDTQGKQWERSHQVRVKRLALQLPGQTWVQGRLDFQIMSGLDEDEKICSVEVFLDPMRAFEETERILFYEGSKIPHQLSLDTLTLDDGAYDLLVMIRTNQGITSTDTQRIVVSNWETIEETFEPPGVWFGGKFDRLKTVKRSNGWEFVGDEAESFFGDIQRITSTSADNEYLIWALPHLHGFSFIVYAQDTQVHEQLRIDVSGDMQSWSGIDYKVEILDRSSSGWLKLNLYGDIPSAGDVDHIRVTVLPGPGANAIQLGHGTLKGLKVIDDH
ncbi:MAG: glycoside hydrolase family 16 protein [Limnochordia bacterium]|nr:glycoside hydrolase family 16 protein [Limnochordia bacterium]MDD4518425.1 glycoside hydrolase family 16 protein [Limnochordia bacterium]